MTLKTNQMYSNEVFIPDRPIGLMGREFANGPGNRGSRHTKD